MGFHTQLTLDPTSTMTHVRSGGVMGCTSDYYYVDYKANLNGDGVDDTVKVLVRAHRGCDGVFEKGETYEVDIIEIVGVSLTQPVVSGLFSGEVDYTRVELEKPIDIRSNRSTDFGIATLENNGFYFEIQPTIFVELQSAKHYVNANASTQETPEPSYENVLSHAGL